MRIFDVGQVFVVGDDGYWVLGSLEVLLPFFQSQYNH